MCILRTPVATKLNIYDLLQSEKDQISRYTLTQEQKSHEFNINEYFSSVRELGQNVNDKVAHTAVQNDVTE